MAYPDPVLRGRCSLGDYPGAPFGGGRVSRWLHKMDQKDRDFARYLVYSAQQGFPELPAVSRFHIADVISRMGIELVNDKTNSVDTLWLGQRYIDISGYLNSLGDDNTALWFRPRWWRKRPVRPPLDIIVSPEGLFVEIERGGKSIQIGTWFTRADGMKVLRITDRIR